MKNTKIKYEAPLIFDLASRGRMQGVLRDCQSGSVANQTSEDDCLQGSTAFNLCTVGSSAAAPSCVGSGAGAAGDCTVSGSSAVGSCVLAGSGA